MPWSHPDLMHAYVRVLGLAFPGYRFYLLLQRSYHRIREKRPILEHVNVTRFPLDSDSTLFFK
jgi:hypothetical protein